MNLIYSKKENPHLYFILGLAILIIFIAGIYFVDRYLWYILVPMGIIINKGINITKNKVIPVIKLNNEGLTILKENQENILYPYSDIVEISMNSNLLNGFLKTKDNSKKIHLNSVAIPITKQKEIVDIVTSKIHK
ncbi:hypothetical protein [Olleya sp. R77988]|uniref:hypothetical protein n=1 Tax=Olleya sp. R77988 TaxID=3093875 RepID=UPI0037CBB963